MCEQIGHLTCPHTRLPPCCLNSYVGDAYVFVSLQVHGRHDYIHYTVFGTNRGSGIMNTTIIMVKNIFIKIDKKEELHKLMKSSVAFIKYEEYYAEIGQRTDKFLKKWGDIYLDLNTIFSK